MRFIWPAQRYDRATRSTTTVAVVLTVMLGVGVFIPAVTVYRSTQSSAISVMAPVRREHITFVEQVTPRPAQSVTRTAITAAPTTPPRVAPVIETDTSSASPAPSEPMTIDAPVNAPVAQPAPVVGSRAGPVLAPVAASQLILLSDAAKDSMSRLFARVWDFKTPLPPTVGQRDSAAREQDRLARVARDEHRPTAIPLGSGGSFSLPFLSRGPTREQRVRDSIIDADNLQRLARLAARARAKRDSLLGANTLAGTKSLHDSAGDSVGHSRHEPRP